MAKNILQELVGKAHKASLKSDHVGSGLVTAKLNVEKQAVLRSIRRALLLLGFGLGFLAIAFDTSWVTDSPLFTVVGSVTCLLFLVVCWLTGALCWLVTGGKVICIWAKSLWPFCVQPYRSASGIPVVFMLIVLICTHLLADDNRLCWTGGKYQQTFLVWLRRLLWLLTIGVWLTALWLNTAGFLKTAVLTMRTAECGRELCQQEIQVARAINREHGEMGEASGGTNDMPWPIADSANKEKGARTTSTRGSLVADIFVHRRTKYGSRRAYGIA